MSLKLEDCLVYATHASLDCGDHSVHADGNIFMYSFNESRPKLIMSRKHAPKPNFNPMVVDVLFAAEGVLFDGGQYGLFDTLQDKQILENVFPGTIAYHEGHVYAGDISRIYKFPLDDYSKKEELNGWEARDWLKQQGVKAKSNFSVVSICDANGQRYITNNNITYETGKRTACIMAYDENDIFRTNPENVILETNWIHDMVTFPEKALLSKIRLNQDKNA